MSAPPIIPRLHDLSGMPLSLPTDYNENTKLTRSIVKQAQQIAAKICCVYLFLGILLRNREYL